jgi:hypothetical protein
VSKPKYANRRHKGMRAKLAPVVAAGRAMCAEVVCLECMVHGRCRDVGCEGRRITPGTPWHLAHTDDGLAYKGPAHERCNTSEGATRGNAMRKVTPRRRAL